MQFPSLNYKTLIYGLYCENRNSLPELDHKLPQKQKEWMYMCLVFSLPRNFYAETYSPSKLGKEGFSLWSLHVG